MNSPQPGTRLMIIDACVLIDYISADRYVLELIVRYVGPLYVVSPIVDEVDGINDADLSEMGLIVIEPEFEDAFTASANSEEMPTSFQDQLCLLTARRHGMACVTNDKNLRTACCNEGVECVWGLQLLLLLHEKMGIPTEEVIEIVEVIHKSNPKHITEKIVSRFNALLGKNK